MQTEIITKIGSLELPTKDGQISASLDSDVWKVAAFDVLMEQNVIQLDFWKILG